MRPTQPQIDVESGRKRNTYLPLISNSHFGARLCEPQHFGIQAAFEWSEILLILTHGLRLTEPRSVFDVRTIQ
jgi:hypothetical protein